MNNQKWCELVEAAVARYINWNISCFATIAALPLLGNGKSFPLPKHPFYGEKIIIVKNILK